MLKQCDKDRTWKQKEWDCGSKREGGINRLPNSQEDARGAASWGKNQNCFFKNHPPGREEKQELESRCDVFSDTLALHLFYPGKFGHQSWDAGPDLLEADADSDL